MKKAFFLFLTIIFVMCSSSIKASTQPHNISDHVIQTDLSSINDTTSYDLIYYPFIYSEEKNWFIENVVGNGNFEEGKLYVKNLKTGVTKQILEEPITVIRESEDVVYFIFNNSIYSVDYEGNIITTIYNSSSVISTSILELYNSSLYFIENSILIQLDLNSKECKEIFKGINPSLLFIKSVSEIIFYENESYYYGLLNESISHKITDEFLLNSLFVDSICTTSATSTTDYNLSSINSSYPSGSYFSNSGSACNHHSSGCSYNGSCGCKQYDYCIQCAGFAKYASDKYSHLSYWNPVSGDQNDTQTSFSTNSDVYLYFASCAKGSYIRLTRSYNDDYGFHSIFLVNVSTTSISTYECNLSGHCDVTYPTRTLSAFRTFSPYSSYYVSHHYYGVKISSGAIYHKVYCSSSGCSGWKYQQHYSGSPGTNATCSGCGYVGNISLIAPID